MARLTVGGLVLQCGGGVLLLLSLRYPLADHGPGSAMPLRSTADLLLGGAVEAWAPRWAGLLLYLPAAFGAGLIVLAGLVSKAARVAALLVTGALSGISLMISFGMGPAVALRPGAGFHLIAAGSTLALMGAVMAFLGGRTRRLSHRP